jgi:hypothetical protein
MTDQPKWAWFVGAEMHAKGVGGLATDSSPRAEVEVASASAAVNKETFIPVLQSHYNSRHSPKHADVCALDKSSARLERTRFLGGQLQVEETLKESSRVVQPIQRLRRLAEASHKQLARSV